MAPRKRCPTCGSRQWHKEPLSGLIACSEGHVLQNYRSETNEVDDYAGPHMTNKRKLKSTKEKKEPDSRANLQLYHGARGRYHYFLCQQLILRMQVEAITKLWSLPPEFEIICRDIWGLHLSLLANPPPPEPYLHAQEGEKDGESSINRKDGSGREATNNETLDGPSSGDVNGKYSNEDNRSGSGDDSEMEELLRENSEISSSSEEGDEDDNDPRKAGRVGIDGWRRTKTTRSIESLASTLAVLVVAFWQLRIPIMYKDLIKVIASYKLPYLDPVRLLPWNVVSHLTKHSIQALSPLHVPKILSVHKLAARLSKKLYATYGVFTPECNAAPLLWRLTKDVGQTPTLYSLAKRMAYILELPLTLHSSLAPGLRRVKAKDSERRKHDNVPPEVALMAAIIIVAKMAYGLDGKPRTPIDEGDPVLALPRIDEWLGLMKKLDELDARDQNSLFSSESEMAVGNLDDGLLDEYLGFCQHALLGEQRPGKLGSADDIARNHFPLEDDARGGEITVAAEKPAWTGLLRAGQLAAEEKAVRPGENYAIWNSRDVFGTLANEYAAVVGWGGKRVEIGEGYLCEVVEAYERRLVRWWEGEGRRIRDCEELNKVSRSAVVR